MNIRSVTYRLHRNKICDYESHVMESYCRSIILRVLPQLIRLGRPVHQSPYTANLRGSGNTMRVHIRYWLDYDTVAFAVLVIGLGILEFLVFVI